MNVFCKYMCAGLCAHVQARGQPLGVGAVLASVGSRSSGLTVNALFA